MSIRNVFFTVHKVQSDSKSLLTNYRHSIFNWTGIIKFYPDIFELVMLGHLWNSMLRSKFLWLRRNNDYNMYMPDHRGKPQPLLGT